MDHTQTAVDAVHMERMAHQGQGRSGQGGKADGRCDDPVQSDCATDESDWSVKGHGKRTEAVEREDMPGMREAVYIPGSLGIQNHVRRSCESILFMDMLPKDGGGGTEKETQEGSKDSDDLERT